MNSTMASCARSLLFLACLCMVASAASADRIWWDGTRENDNPPPGSLLSDNDGYWGGCVLTGVEYHYESSPNAPADV